MKNFWIMAFMIFAFSIPSYSSGSKYVSDQFKSVAKNVFKQFVASQIQKSCPKNQLLCPPLVARLSQAFEYAIEGDNERLWKSLNGFFYDATIISFLDYGLGNFFQKEEAHLVEIKESLHPIIKCLTSTISGQAPRNNCVFSIDDLKLLKKLPEFKGNDEEVKNTLLHVIENGGWPEPDLMLRFLAGIVELDIVGRSDLRFFLLRLAEMTEAGLSEGVFGAVLEVIISYENKDNKPLKSLLYYQGERAHGMLVPGTMDNKIKTINDCGSKKNPLVEWKKLISDDVYLEKQKNKFLNDEPVVFQQLEDVLELKECKDPVLNTKLIRLKKKVQYFLTPLKFQSFLNRYSPPILAAAALVEFIQTDDQEKLKHNLLQTMAYSSVHFYSKNNINSEKFDTLKTQTGWVLQSCESIVLHESLNLYINNSADTCYSIKKGEFINESELEYLGDFEFTQDWLKQNSQKISEMFGFFLNSELKKSKAYYSQMRYLNFSFKNLIKGNVKSATKKMIWMGADLIEKKVEVFAQNFTHADKDECESELGSNFIFTGMGKGCFAYFLINTAYQPIVEFFWDKGNLSEGSDETGGSITKQLLNSPLSQMSPILINVGLGVSAINNEDVNLTVLDKFGLKIFQYNSKSNQFETGPFVGGFLDAFVKTTTDIGKKNIGWLAGWTLGWKKMLGLDFGLEGHVGSFMPFDLTGSYGFTYGGAFIVPVSYVFNKEE